MSTGIFPQFMHSGQTNAPQMSGATGAEGQILQVLDACLISGFNSQTAASVTIEADLIKITYGVNHGYERLQFLIIEGATAANFNGKHRIVKHTQTTLHIAKGAVTDVSGTIKTKIVPLDWESMFGSGNALKRAYRSKNLQGTRSVLYLDCELKSPNSYHSTKPMKKALVNVCGDMTTLGEQIDSYTDYYNKRYVDGALQWLQSAAQNKTQAAPTDNSPWLLFGDGDIFYFCVGWNNYNTRARYAIYAFGDTPKVSQADQYNCFFSATILELPNNNEGYYSSVPRYTWGGSLNTYDHNLGGGTYFIKPVSGVGSLDRVFKWAMLAHEGFIQSGRGGLSNLNPLTFGLVFSDIYLEREKGSIGVTTLPYIKAIANDLGDSSEYNLTQHNDYLLFNTPQRHNSHTDDFAYYAINLMEQRQADRS